MPADFGFVADDLDFKPDDLGFEADAPAPRMEDVFAREAASTGKPVANIANTTRAEQAFPEEFRGPIGPPVISADNPLVNLDVGIVPPEALRSVINAGTKYTINPLTIAETLGGSKGKEFSEGVRGGAAEMGSGMTSVNSLKYAPAFAIPGVGEVLAAKMGAESLGTGAGRAYAALEQGNPRELGGGLVEGGVGALMAYGGAKGGLNRLPSRAGAPEVPNVPNPDIVARNAIIDGAQQTARDTGLHRTAEALETVKKSVEAAAKEPVALDQVQQFEKPIETSLADQVAAMPPAEFLQWSKDQRKAGEVSGGADALSGVGVEKLKELAAKADVERDTLSPQIENAQTPESLAPGVMEAHEAAGLKGQFFREAIKKASKVETPKAVTPLEADIAAENANNAAMMEVIRAKDFDPMVENPRLMELGREMQTIKNRYQGRKPSDVLKETQVKAAPIATEVSKTAPIDTPVPESVVVSEVTPVTSMGGMAPGERLKSPLASVEDSLKTLAEAPKPSVSKAFEIGSTVAKLKDRVSDTAVGLQVAGKYLKQKLEGKPVWNTWKDALGERHLALSESAVNARKFAATAEKAMPDKLDREAISNYIDTGGDAARLKAGAIETPDRYKAGYERAQKLTPEQKTVAENLRNYFEKRLEDAQEAGILEDGIENYLHRAYEKDSSFKKGAIAELRSGLFAGKPALAKQRVFEYDLDAEKAGLKPVKDFVQRVGQYDLALNKAIADRTAVKAMMEIKMPDGRPMIDVGGGGKTIEAPTGETQATLINRSAKKIDENSPEANRGDYKSYDHPALRKWKWVMNDTEGKPVFVQGDVLIHPDAIGQIEKLLGRSRIRQNPIGRAALNVSSTIKQTMLDLSGFHQVQIGVHGMEHRTFKPVREIDFTDPDVRGLIKGGAVVGETAGQHMFNEGLSGSSLTKHIPWIGDRIQKYQSYLFEDYIPRLKTAMGLHALERNRAKYPDLSKDELYHITANQMNAAFGELNYEMMGRSKTMQDALRLTLLAPDFLEARTRFTGQAATKYGAEQRNALLLGAATMYVTARIMNKLLDDEYHFEPKNAFNIVYKGKSYGLRTVQGDLIHAATEPGKFANHRLNPIYGKPVLETLTGRDYFGRKRSVGERLEDVATTPVPISLKGLMSGREQSLLESFLNSFGFVTKRDSPSSELNQLAQEWREKNKVRGEAGEFIYDADKDPYRQIKLAADYDDEAAVRSEIAKAINDGVSKQKILDHFRLSASHNYAGSEVNERKFVQSLSKDQQEAYRKSKVERARIRDVVKAALMQ